MPNVMSYSHDVLPYDLSINNYAHMLLSAFETGHMTYTTRDFAVN